MSCHPKSLGSFGGRRPSLRFLLCLFALLSYLFLPQFFNLRSHQVLQALEANLGAGPGIFAGHPGKPPSPNNDDNVTICQDSSDFQDYGLVSLPRVQDGPLPLRLAVPGNAGAPAVKYALLVEGPRAPPVSQSFPSFICPISSSF